jgi:hypothetical protein
MSLTDTLTAEDSHMQPLVETLELRTLAAVKPLAAGVVGPALAYEIQLIAFEVKSLGWGGGHYWVQFSGFCTGQVEGATAYLYSDGFHLLEHGWGVPLSGDGSWSITCPWATPSTA